MSSLPRIGAIVAVLVVIAGVGWALRPRPAPTEATYVGRSACAGCHEAESALWSGSHHDLAMQEATAESVLGDFADATFTYGGLTSTFYRRDGSWRVRTDGPDGRLTEYEIAYTFGFSPLQQYLIELPGGRYQALSIAWDARPEPEGGQRWFHLYPDADIGPDDALHWTKPSQNWNRGCAECHSTDVRKGFDVASRSYETTWSELDVSCEACHGPGSAHLEMAGVATRIQIGDDFDWGLVVDLVDAGRVWSVPEGATTAVRAVAPSSDGEIEACAQCHARRGMIAEQRLPGQPLLETHVPSLLREDLYHADGQVLDEVYVYGSFLQSRMYAAGVTCSDCHDPHTLRPRAEGNALCARCHLPDQYDAPTHHFHEASSEGAWCIACHMPETTYMVVDPRRDHSLRIPRPDLTLAIGTPNACDACHEDRPAEWASDAIERWYGPASRATHYGETLHAARSGAPPAGPAIVELARDAAQPAIVRATALGLLTTYPAPLAAGAIAVGLRDRSPLVRLGALRGLTPLPPQTVGTLAFPLLADPVRANRIEAARSLARLQRASFTAGQAEALDRGVREYEAAQLANADHASAWVNLADLYDDRGQPDQASNAYTIALALDPDYMPARLNYADMLRRAGREDEAERVLTEAPGASRSTPEVEHALGLLYVRRGNSEQALTLLASAAAARPENARFAYVHGVALGSAGRMPEAISVLEAGLTARPFDRDLLTALATYHRDLGGFDEAIAYAERLADVQPEDTAVQQLLTELRAARR